MATIETIRKLTFVAADSGLTQLNARLSAVADAGGDVAKAQQAMSVSADTASRGAASLEKNVAAMERRFLPAAKQAQELDRTVRDLFQAAAQGVDASRLQNVFNAVMDQTIEAKREQAVISREQANVEKALIEYAAKRSAREAEITAHIERQTQAARLQAGAEMRRRIEETTGVAGDTAKSARESAAVFQEQITAELKEQAVIERAMADAEAKRAARAKEHADYEERVAKAYREQQALQTRAQIETATGVSRTPATAGGATTSAFKEQADEQERLAAFTREIVQQAQPEQAAAQRRIRQTIDLAHAYSQGLIPSIEAYNAAQKQIDFNAQRSAKGIGLTTSQVAQLGYQLNDVLSGLAMGQSPFTIITQQTGQVVQAIQGPSGIKQGFIDLGKLLFGLVTPGRVAFAGIAAGAALAAYAYNRFADQQIAVQATLLGVGARLGLTSKQFIEMAQTAATAGKISGAAGIDIATQLARGTRLGGDSIAQLTRMGKDFAATFELSMNDVGAAMTKAFSSEGGIMDLDRQLNFLNGLQVQTIRQLFEVGKGADAARIAIDALNKNALTPSAEAHGRWAQAMEVVKRSISDVVTEIGKYIASLNDVEATENRRKNLPQFAPFGAEARRKAEATAAAAREISGREQFGPPASMMASPEQIAREKELNQVLNERSKQAASFADEYGRRTAEGIKWARVAKEINELATTGTEEQKKAVAATQGWGETVDVVNSTLQSLKNTEGQLMTEAEKLGKIQQLNAKIDLERNETRANALKLERDELMLAGQAMGEGERRIKVTQGQVDAQVQHIKAIRDEVNYSRELRTTYGLVGDSLELANTMTQKRIQYEQRGITLTQQDTAALKEQAAATIEHTRAQSQLNKIYEDFIRPGEEFTRVINAADHMLAEGKINVQQYSLALLDAQIKMEQASKTMEGGMRAGLLTVQRDFGDTSKLMEGFVTSTAGQMVTAFADITDGTKTTADGFRDLAKSVIRALEEMVIKMMIVAPIAKALQGAIGGTSGIFSFLGFGGAAGTVKAGQVHSGGIVSGYGHQRFVDPRMFIGAPRYHNGGIAGEVPAILRRNEEVLTPGDPRHRDNGGGGMTLNVNVSGARGNSEIMDMVYAGVRQGISGYDASLNQGGLARKMSNVRIRGQR